MSKIFTYFYVLVLQYILADVFDNSIYHYSLTLEIYKWVNLQIKNLHKTIKMVILKKETNSPKDSKAILFPLLTKTSHGTNLRTLNYYLILMILIGINLRIL